MRRDTFANEAADWWLDRVVYLWFEIARGRHWSLKVVALTFGTLWAFVAMVVGLPILFVAVVSDAWNGMQ